MCSEDRIRRKIQVDVSYCSPREMDAALLDTS